MVSCDKHHWLDTAPEADECPTCRLERVLAGRPSGQRPIEILTQLEHCLAFLEWLLQHPMDFGAVLAGELPARELVARYAKGQ